jgi:hypothetical protein
VIYKGGERGFAHLGVREQQANVRLASSWEGTKEALVEK